MFTHTFTKQCQVVVCSLKTILLTFKSITWCHSPLLLVLINSVGCLILFVSRSVSFLWGCLYSLILFGLRGGGGAILEPVASSFGMISNNNKKATFSRDLNTANLAQKVNAVISTQKSHAQKLLL